MSSAPFPLSYLFGSFAVESSGIEQLPFSVRRSLLWGERVCLYYMRNGSCKYGSNYRFNHLDPTAAGGCDPPFGFDNGGPASLQWWIAVTSWSAPNH